MSTLQFANDAITTLAAGTPVSGAGSTTFVLASGTGALFPAITGTQTFKMTLWDAATQTINEIVLVTGISTDTLTVIRGQEGSTPRAWNVGDIAGNYITAGTAADFVQSEQAQLGTYEIATVTGAVNTIVGTVTSNLTALTNGMRVRFPSQGPNTTAVTFNLTLGATATGALPVITADTSVVGGTLGLQAGIMPAIGYNVDLTYSAILASWVLSPIAPINQMPRAWAIFSAGTLSSSFNIATWSKSATGVYNFTFTYLLQSPGYGINFGSQTASAGAYLSSPTTGGGTLNGFNTTTAAALDINGMVTIWGA